MTTNVLILQEAFTNEAFLRHLYGEKWGQALVCFVAGDPERASRGAWSGYSAEQMLQMRGQELLNAYFSVGGAARSLADFRELRVIVLDDVGTKVSLSEAKLLLGPPTWVLETSPDNFQAGWCIEPVVDRERALGLVRGVYEALGGQGDNLTNVVGWMRLPIGSNGKSKYLVDHPGGFRHRLVAWNPGVKLDTSTWVVRPVGLGPGFGRHAAEMPDPGEIEEDAILQAFRLLGRVQGLGRPTTMGWGFDVECPWAGDHTDRVHEGAVYVPVLGRFCCHHGHCQDKGTGDVRVRLDELLKESGHGNSVAALEFDEIDPQSVSVPAVASASSPFPADGAIDLWDDKTLPSWPGGVLPAVLEDTLFELSERDGLDLGALGATMITAASGAADKRHLLQPYAGSGWLVRPILWLMLVAESGLRKTTILSYLLAQLRRLNAERMRNHARVMAEWRALPRAARAELPMPTVAPLLAEDVTVEKLQEWMSGNPKGMLYLRDELAALFDFGRYSGGPGAAERAFLLEAYEGGPQTIGRMTRTTIIDNCSLAMLGATQPERLAEFKNLAHDGFLSRFGVVVMQDTGGGVETARITDIGAVNATIDRVLRNGAFDAYRTDVEGEAVIRALERLCTTVATRPDIGVGFKGFIRKLHGTAARTALILHLMDGGDEEVIPADTVARAELYARFLFMHADVFYAGLPGSPENIARAIGSFLIRNPHHTKVTAGQLRRDVALCRPLRTLREIQDALFLLVSGGWLKPVSQWPTNSAWKVRPGLADQFAARAITETKRVEGIKEAMNWLGRHR